MSLQFFARIISRNREAYLLKIGAVSVALATSIAVALFSVHEFGFDRFHLKPESIFRVIERNTDENFNGNRLSAKVPGHIYDTLSSNHYDSLIVSRVKIMHGVELSDSAQSEEITIHAVDKSIESIFSFDIIDGNFFYDSSTSPVVVVSSTFAENHWGSTQVTGKHLKFHTFGDTLNASIVGVFNSFPDNSHEKFDVLIKYDSAALESLNFNPAETGIYARALTESILHFKIENTKVKRSYTLQPITEIYFGPRMLGEGANHGDRYSVVLLICMALLILFLAGTTLINLTALTLPYRSKELAVKKLAGTTREILIIDFLKESGLLVLAGLMISFLFFIWFDNSLQQFFGFSILATIKASTLTSIGIVTILVFILAVPPVLMTLRFAQATPNRLLSSDTITFPSLKRWITFAQLGVSIFLIVGSLVVRRQINYSLVKEPGQNHDQIVYLNSPRGITNESINNLRMGWRKNNPNILDVMAVSQLPDKLSSKEIGSDFYQLVVDPGFREFFGLNMVAGSWFGPNSPDTAFVINTAATRLVSSRAQALGVIENVNERFNLPERPTKFINGSDYAYNWLCVRVLEVNIRSTVERLTEDFSAGAGYVKVNYLNHQFKSWLEYQDRLNRISSVLTMIAGLLSCFAIYALSVSLVRDKVKQIALNHLFGAGTIAITMILLKDFARQLILALLIFLPLSYLALSELLRTFAYATSVTLLDSVYPFIYCVSTICVICSFQAWQIRRTNPIEALKG